MIVVERDKWYYVVDCMGCDRPTVLREAPDPDEVPGVGLRSFAWKCPYCRERQTSPGEQIARCQGIYL